MRAYPNSLQINRGRWTSLHCRSTEILLGIRFDWDEAPLARYVRSHIDHGMHADCVVYGGACYAHQWVALILTPLA